MFSMIQGFMIGRRCIGPGKGQWDPSPGRCYALGSIASWAGAGLYAICLTQNAGYPGLMDPLSNGRQKKTGTLRTKAGRTPAWKTTQ